MQHGPSHAHALHGQHAHFVQHPASHRRCPRCTYPLDVLDFKGVHVDHCYRCGGSFLDPGETGGAVGWDADPQRWRREALARPPQQTNLWCPAGHAPMWSYVLGWNNKFVEVDACGVCHGMWLDANEAQDLADITSEVKAEHTAPGAQHGTASMVATYVVQLITFMPVEVYHPVKRKPVLVHGLLIANALLFGLEMVLIQKGPSAIERFLDIFAFIPAKLSRGENVWTVITYAFLHGSIFHLLGNLYYLWLFGDNVEDMLGRKRFTILYLATAVAGCLAHWAGNLGAEGPMVGASGAISGLMGAYLVLFPKVRLWVVFLFIRFKLRAFWYMIIWVGMQVLLIFDPKTNVAWLAHMGGFAAGALLALAFRPKDGVPLSRRA